MSSFDKIIGYETVKQELKQISDMIHNKERYEKMGAKLPQGILLSGIPGLGKSLMARCFIEDCNLNTYILRKNQGSDNFVNTITETFRLAK